MPISTLGITESYEVKRLTNQNVQRRKTSCASFSILLRIQNCLRSYALVYSSVGTGGIL